MSLSQETEPLVRSNRQFYNTSVSLIHTSYAQHEEVEGGTQVRMPISRNAINEGIDNQDDMTTSQRHEVLLRRDHDFGFRLRLGLIRRVDSRNALPPNHVVPSHYFIFLPFVPKDGGEQSSIITILAIWNTMLGTSILCMPWALQEAGFALGIAVMVFMALVCWYTSYLVIRNSDIRQVSDFSTVCHERLGNWARILALTFSLISLAGAMIVYFVLLCNFLFHVVDFLYHISTPYLNHTAPVVPDRRYPDVLCNQVNSTWNGNSSDDPNFPLNINASDSTIYGLLWQQYRTVPFWLLLVVVPLVSLKSPSFFTKFNAFGALSVFFLIGMVIYKCAVWGVHFDVEGVDPTSKVTLFRGSTFVVVAGIGSLALFIHNAVIAIMKNQKYHENNVRDLSAGYVLGLVTYLVVGCVFYIGFPLPKSCIEDNLLNNLTSADLISSLARAFLLFQMVTVFPLLVYIFRSQLMIGIFNDEYPGVVHVTVLNVVVLIVCIAFAMFFPSIGKIIRFVGAFCGMIYIFTLPVLVQMQDEREKGTLTMWKIVPHVCLMVLGVAIFVGQLATIGE